MSQCPVEKERMNLIENTETIQELNIFSLFNEELNESSDLETEGDEESMTLSEPVIGPVVPRVSESMFPDQSLFVLEEQLKALKSNLSRIKFYMGDINDLITH